MTNDVPMNRNSFPDGPARFGHWSLVTGHSPDLPLTDLRHPFHVLHMEMALEEAAQAADEDEVPIGAVIVSLEQGVIARAHNQREQLNDPTAHAEMIALTQAARALGSWRGGDCPPLVTPAPRPRGARAAQPAPAPPPAYCAPRPQARALAHPA